jgi:hypothetical protein
MFPNELRGDSEAAARDRTRTDLRDSLTVIAARMQLLHRQVLRDGGLADRERETMLAGLAAALKETRWLGAQIETLIAGDEFPPAAPSHPVVTP